MVDNFLKNNFAILFGNMFFKVGGYIYKFLMIYLLNTYDYGILTVVWPFQNILQTLAAGGLPPTISKYVSQYNATQQRKESYKIILVSLKIAIILGIIFALLMIFFIAPVLVRIYNNNALLVPLQLVGLIVPFSAVVGVFRGVFQGAYKMEYILVSRSIEQIAMISSAFILILIGFSVIGAIFGSIIGFLFSLISVLIILNKYFHDIISGMFKIDLDFKNEIKIAYKIISFSVPVILIAISEIGIYSMTTTIMPLFLTISEIGYFGISEPIARLPLMISNSLATTMLPVSSEMIATNDRNKLQKYAFNTLRYNLMIMVPLCVFLMIFSKEILLVVFFTKPTYSKGSLVLSILSLGMFFYSIFAITSSVIQGIGRPKISMYCLIGGFIQILLLSFLFISYFGVIGGALATTITTGTITLISLIYLNKLINLQINFNYYLKILFAGLVVTLFLISIPKNIIGFYLGLIFLFPLYLIILMLIKGFNSDDFYIIMKFKKKIPVKFPLKILEKIVNKGIR